MQVRERLDVELLEDLPSPPPNWRWLDFFGPDTRFRAFLVPRAGQRQQFMVENSDLLDPVVRPVFEDDHLEVAIDPTFAVPGTFVVALKGHYPSPDQVPLTTHQQMAFVTRSVIAGLRTLGVGRIRETTHWHEDKPTSKVHDWLVPIYRSRIPPSSDGTQTTDLLKLDMVQYVSGFRYSDDGPEVRRMRGALGAYLERERLEEKLEILGSAISGLGIDIVGPRSRQPSIDAGQEP